MPKIDSQKGAIEISTIAGMAIVAAVVVVASTIAVIKYREASNIVSPITVTTPKLTPEATPIVDVETASWQIYRNEEYGFEVNYPSVYKLIAPPQLNEYQKNQGIAYLAYLKHSSVDASIFIQFMDLNFNLRDIERRFSPTGDENLPSQLTVGQNTFYFYGPGGGGVSYPDNYFYNINDKILVIGFNGPYINDKTPSDETKQLEPQILSTFKFTK